MILMNNEEAIDPEAFESRDWPGDRLIKVLVYAAKLGIQVTEVDLSPSFAQEIKAQLGSKMTDKIYGPLGACKLLGLEE